MRLFALKLVIIFFIVTCFVVNAENYPTGQLSDDVVPISYNLKLKIDPAKEIFYGTTQININIKKPLNFFWVHGDKLKVSSVILKTHDGQELKAAYEQVSIDGVVKITLPKKVATQKAKLVLQYEAKLTNELSGLYKVVVDKISYAFTQFEPISARECFPGFDEPRFKTPFFVELIVPENVVAIANTPVVSEKKIGNGEKLVSFLQTKPLSTYLVAFAVGPFDVVESKPLAVNSVRKNTVPFRGIAVKGMGDKLKYALRETPRLVQLLEEYFQVPYPYEKLDIIAVPDFSAGAMENAGAITFRDNYLIIDDKTAPESQKRGFTNIMAHELAHQWFGNWVTMRWWDDLWLNEAFATWMSYLIEDQYNPSYKAQLSMLNWIHQAMRDDSLVSARQIKQPIKSYHDIHNAFDSITYAKGASVLSMFENYLGKGVFQESVKYHLNRFAFGTATAEDFVDSLSTVSKKNLQSSFFSFIAKPGVPWASIDFQCNGNEFNLKFAQSRYFPIGSSGNANQTWGIPFCYKYGVDEKINEACTLMKSRRDTLKVQSECPNWFVANANAAGYYYWTTPHAEALSQKYLNELSEEEQFDLINNIQAGFVKGDVNAKVFFDLIPNFASKDNRFVSIAPYTTLKWIDEHVISRDLKKPFENYVSKLYRPIYNKLVANKIFSINAEEKNLFLKDLNHILANLAKDKKVREELIKHGADYVQDLQQRKAAEGTELAMVSVSIWAEETPSAPLILKKLLAQTNDPMQRINLIKAFGLGISVQDKQVIFETLLGQDLRRNEVMPLFYAFMSNAQKREAGWTWFKKNYKALAKVLPEQKQAGFPYLAYNFCSEEKAAEVKQFFAGKIEKLPGGPKNLKEVLEHISLCQSLVKAQRESIERFLKAIN